MIFGYFHLLPFSSSNSSRTHGKLPILTARFAIAYQVTLQRFSVRVGCTPTDNTPFLAPVPCYLSHYVRRGWKNGPPLSFKLTEHQVVRGKGQDGSGRPFLACKNYLNP